MKNFNQVGSGGETEPNENSFTNTEFEPWDESKAPKIETTTEQTSMEDARAAVMDSLKKNASVGNKDAGTQRFDMGVVNEQLPKDLEQFKNNPPDDVADIPQWINTLNRIPADYANARLLNENSTEEDIKTHDEIRDFSRIKQFDPVAYLALSKKHSGDMPSETREIVYDSLAESPGEMISAFSGSILHQIRKNIISLQGSGGEKVPGAKSVEEDALRTFEDIAVKEMKDLGEAEKQQIIESTEARIRLLESIISRQEKRYNLTLGGDTRGAKKVQEDISRLAENFGVTDLANVEQQLDDLKRLNKGSRTELFANAKRSKFLYQQALNERGKVSGFMNKRQLKRPENALPDSYEEFKKNPHAYSDDRLRQLALNYVSMQ